MAVRMNSVGLPRPNRFTRRSNLLASSGFSERVFVIASRAILSTSSTTVVNTLPRRRAGQLKHYPSAVIDFTGRWWITDMELWDAEARDLMGPAYLEFDLEGTGAFRFVAVSASMDCRVGMRDGKPLVEFSWHGYEDTEVTGRGWGVIEGDRLLKGRMYIHLGDDSSFVAQRAS